MTAPARYCPECGWPVDKPDSPGKDADHSMLVHVYRLADGRDRAWTAGGDSHVAYHDDPYEAAVLAVRSFADERKGPEGQS